MSKKDMFYKELIQLDLNAKDQEDLEKCRKLHFWEKYRYEYSSRHFSEVVAKHTGKHVAAKQLLKVLKTNEEKIFAAGNGMNDFKENLESWGFWVVIEKLRY